MSRSLLNWLPQLFDLTAAVMVGTLATFWLIEPEWQPAYYSHTPLYLMALYLAGYWVRLYGSWRGARLGELMVYLLLAWGLGSVLFTYLTTLLNTIPSLSRGWLLCWTVGGFGVSALFRWGAYSVLRSLRRRGFNRKSVMLVASEASALRIRQKTEGLPNLEFYFVDDFVLDQAHIAQTDEQFEGVCQQLLARLDANPVDEIWIGLPLAAGDKVRYLHDAVSRYSALNVRYLPDLSDFRLFNHQVRQIGALLVLDLSRTPMEGGARLLKFFEDRVLGLLLFIVSLPVMLLIALVVKLTSKGPVLFKQYRQGLDGKPFKIYKFRTMHYQPSAAFQQACHGDQRITPVGRFLRRTSLDELPQFYNVLQGRMSIVGPRPHVVEQNVYYSKVIKAYMQRYRVKPGITGWAQVHGFRGLTETDDVMRKRVEYDFYYINNWSLALDLKIIALTVINGFLNRQP